MIGQGSRTLVNTLLPGDLSWGRMDRGGGEKFSVKLVYKTSIVCDTLCLA